MTDEQSANPSFFETLFREFSEDAQRQSTVTHLAGVGAVASLWANFEITIDRYALEIGRIPFQAGHCLTSQIAGSGRKLEAYCAIARLRGADALARELNKFLSASNAIAL